MDPKEEPILDQLLSIRDRLSLLKRDKSTYVKSHDVLTLYEEVIIQVHLLNILRKEHSKPLEQNRGLSSCLQFYESLFYYHRLPVGSNCSF